jgi:hypothetical protein
MNLRLGVINIFFPLLLLGCGYTIIKSKTANFQEESVQNEEYLKFLEPIQKINDESFWKKRIGLVKLGMTRAQVYKILPKYDAAATYDGHYKKNTQSISYSIDLHWYIEIRFDFSGSGSSNSFFSDQNRLVEKPVLTPQEFRSPTIN